MQVLITDIYIDFDVITTSQFGLEPALKSLLKKYNIYIVLNESVDEALVKEKMVGVTYTIASDSIIKDSKVVQNAHFFYLNISDEINFDTATKVHNCDELFFILFKQSITSTSARNGVIGMTVSSFDLLHAGHAMMLEEAKSHCDYLVVGLQFDPTIDRPEKNKPIQSLQERFVQISANKNVDEVLLYDTEDSLITLFKEVNPDVRIIGADWKGKPFTGHELPIKVIFNSRDHDYSTSSLRKRIYEAEKSKK